MTWKRFICIMIPVWIACFAAGFMVIVGFKPVSPQHATATAIQRDGMYLFVSSTPASEYEVLGTVKKTGIVMSGSPEEMIKIICRRAQKDYPNTEGIIFDDMSLEHATCIKFK